MNAETFSFPRQVELVGKAETQSGQTFASGVVQYHSFYTDLVIKVWILDVKTGKTTAVNISFGAPRWPSPQTDAVDKAIPAPKRESEG